MRIKKHRPLNENQSSRLQRIALAIFSLGFAFTSWGYLNSGAKPSADENQSLPASANFVHQEREAALQEARYGQKKMDSEGDAMILMNDPFMAQQSWGLEKTAAHQAWEISQGSKDIVVAVIDTGIDVHHPDLKKNLWVNAGESGLVNSEYCRKQSLATIKRECDKATNGIDDDNNGFIDDVNGWNFVQNDNKLTDNHGHGTHIAGIIGARSESGSGVNGVSPKVSLMMLKYYDPKAPHSNNLRNTIQAIRYAVRMKATIINYSGGGTDYSPEEFAAVKEAESAGILFVAAAGNERSNSDEAGKHYYPADYDLTNIISVTAVNKEETKVLASSNYGVRTVDIAAPGENIYSTLPGGSYGLMTGTSQATAFVTGVAALVKTIHRDFSASDVKKYILRTGDEYTTLLSKTGTAKLLNSYRALTSLDKGVSVNGVLASNTSKMRPEMFAAGRNLKDAKLDTSALSTANDGQGEPAESIAMFGRDFVKAIEQNRDPAKIVDPASETRQR